MGILNSLREQRSAESRASLENPSISLSDPRAFELLFGEEADAAGERVSADTALSVPAIWAAVNFISGTIASLPLSLYARDEEGRKVQKSNPLHRLLHDAVNPEWSSYRWRKYSMTHTLTSGRSLTFIERNVQGRVMNLWPLNPKNEIIDVPFMIEADQVTHISPVSKLKRAVGLSIALERYATRFFNNGGVPPLQLVGPLQSPAAAGRAAKDITSAIDMVRQGDGNILPMPTGHELKQIGFDPEKGQLTAARLFQVREVARVFDLPPVFLQDLEHGTFCLPADAEVLTERGPIRIADIRAGERVYSRAENGGIVSSLVSRIACTGHDPILTVRTSNRTIRLNARHRVLARRAHERPLRKGEIGGRNVGGRKVRVEWHTEYVPAGELQEGDTIVGFNGSPDNGSYICPTRPLTEDFMEFCGLLLGDGNVEKAKGKPIGVSIARAAAAPYMDHYRNIMRSEFHGGGYSVQSGRCDGSGKLSEDDLDSILASSRGAGEIARLSRNYDVDPKTIKRIWTDGGAAVALRDYELREIEIHEHERSTRFASTAAAKELTDLGLSGTAHNKTIPGWVFGVADDLKLAFLRGFLDADGSVDKKGRIAFSSCNKSLLSGVRHLCMMLGVPITNLYTREGETLLPNGETANFRQHYFTCSDPGANRRIGSHTPEYVRRMEAGRPFNAKKGRAYPRYGGCGFDEAGAELSRIVSIEVGNSEPVYDMEVVGTHSFIADGVIVHNSNTEQQDLHFVKHTLTQWLKAWEQEMNLKLFPASNRRDFVEFNVDGLLRGDFKTRMDGYSQAIQNAIKTPNEVRSKENDPALEGGDNLFIQGATVPLASQMQLPLGEGEGGDDPGSDEAEGAEQ